MKLESVLSSSRSMPTRGSGGRGSSHDGSRLRPMRRLRRSNHFAASGVREWRTEDTRHGLRNETPLEVTCQATMGARAAAPEPLDTGQLANKANLTVQNEPGRGKGGPSRRLGLLQSLCKTCKPLQSETAWASPRGRRRKKGLYILFFTFSFRSDSGAPETRDDARVKLFG